MSAPPSDEDRAPLVAFEPDAGNVEALAQWLHSRHLFDHDYCDHGTYSGGPNPGEPYAMCEREAVALLASDWLANLRAEVAHTAAKKAGEQIAAAIRDRRRGFNRLGADEQYLLALDDAFGLASNIAREPERKAPYEDRISMTSPATSTTTENRTSRTIDAAERLAQAYRDLEALRAETTTVCALCGDEITWHPGNGGQWLGANPPRDWTTCGGVVDGPHHQTHHEANIATAAKREERADHLTPDEIAALLDQARADTIVSACATIESERDGFLASPSLNPAWIAGWHAAVDHMRFRLATADHTAALAAVKIEAEREVLIAAAKALPSTAKMPWLHERGENDWWGERPVSEWLQERSTHLPKPSADPS